jgi:hypothetical protein
MVRFERRQILKFAGVAVPRYHWSPALRPIRQSQCDSSMAMLRGLGRNYGSPNRPDFRSGWDCNSSLKAGTVPAAILVRMQSCGRLQIAIRSCL